ncbi:MAG: enoyl-CoA hydratase-related protein [Afipia sp.]|nr:enoyl-CoA hydratase-related protein [Afipia sp.]
MTINSVSDTEAQVVIRDIDERGVARITINRPTVHNAWNPQVVAALTDAIEFVSAAPHVRAVVLTGEGKSFSAGGDLRWMRGILDQSSEQRREDADRIGRLLVAIDSCPKPVIARINGAAIGGGIGLVCACDIAVACNEAVFGLSEVRLGIIPAMISPFVVRRLGEARARAHFLTGHDPMPAERALSIGLVHHVVARDDLDAAVEAELRTVLRSSPAAIAEAKRLFRREGARDLDATIREAADALVRTWEGGDAREGLTAFLEKRNPCWY